MPKSDDNQLLEWLRQFVTLAECGNFTQAARQLYITQQGLSHNLSRLEAWFGQPLVVRQRRYQGLTPAGAALLPKARYCLQSFFSVQRWARSLSQFEQDSLELRIAQTTEWNFDLLTLATIDAFRRSYPGVQVKVRTIMPYEIETALKSGELDLVLGLPSRPGPNVRRDFLAQVPYLIVAASSMSQHWTQMAYIAPVYHPAQPIQSRGSFEQEYHLAVAMLAPSIDVAIQLCLQGLGAMYVPQLSVSEYLRSGALRIVAPSPSQEVQMLWGFSQALTPPRQLAAFAETLRYALAEQLLADLPSSVAQREP